jgi:hypothetical protein
MDMEKNTQTVFISLAGVGGCSVSRALRSLGQNALPFDWLIARQDFVISAIESGGTAFFDFDDHARLHGETIITVPDRSALSIHDFRQNWAAEKENVRKKYRRRWNRFHDILYSRPGARQPRKIVFVRSFLDMDEPIESIYDNIFVRQKEDVRAWEDFLAREQRKNPGTEMHLVIVTSRDDVKSQAPKVHVLRLKNYKDYKEIKKALKKLMTPADRLRYLKINASFALEKFLKTFINFFSAKPPGKHKSTGANPSGSTLKIKP